jgi:hypothetical protein
MIFPFISDIFEDVASLIIYGILVEGDIPIIKNGKI